MYESTRKDQQDKEAVQASIHKNAVEYGNKTANLQELGKICPGNIPSFFPLSHTEVISHLNQYAPKWQELWREFQAAQKGHTTSLTEVALPVLEHLRQLVITTFQHHPISSERVQDFLNELKAKDANLMVRSTGHEDTLDMANPGGNVSIATVEPNIAAVSAAIGEVIASYFSEKSLKQRLLSADESITQTVFMPVLLQQMIGEPVYGYDYSHQVPRSGVMYTGKDLTRIQIAPGHGELVVNSKALFDTFHVIRGKQVYAEINHKPYRLAPSVHGLDWKKNRKALQSAASISSKVALKIEAIGQAIENHYGMPMDVEFIYDPVADDIAIVQARPIPAARLKTITPSSVPPDKMPALKEAIQRQEIQKCGAQVIAPAGFAAKVISKPQSVLISNTIEEALEDYLKQTDSPVQAVLVRDMAPSTSHAAAQFSALAIPVLQVDNITTAKDWVKANQVMLLDVQRNQLLNVTALIPDSTDASQALKDQGYLAEGMFTYPISPTTEQRVFVDTATLKQLFKKIKPVPIDKAHVYTQLMESLETLEAIMPNSPNKDAYVALDKIRYIYYRLGQANREQMGFFGQAILLCEEIEKSIGRMTAMSLKDDTQTMKEEHLRLVARLKSLTTYPGNQDTFSNSIQQMHQEKKARQVLNSQVLNTRHASFNAEQLDYISQFLKLNKMALNSENKDHWTQLVMGCMQDNKKTQQLAYIVKFYVENQLDSDLINKDLPGIMANHSTEDALEKLYNSCRVAESEFSKFKLEEAKSTLKGWEQRISAWGDIHQFDALWADYEKTLLPLIQQLRFSEVDTFSDTYNELQEDSLSKDRWSCLVLPELTSHEILEQVETDFAYVFSGEQLYFVNKSTNTCHLSHMSAEEAHVTKDRIKQSRKKNHGLSCGNIRATICGGLVTILKDYDFIETSHLSYLTQRTIFKRILELTDLMDRNIKALQSSADDYDDEALLVTRFATLLKPYHELMRHWVSTIPNPLFKNWNSKSAFGAGDYNERLPMLDSIKESFEKHTSNLDIREMKPSGNISIPAVTVGTTASFERQFVSKEVTLDDLFSLFHQNILNAVGILSRSNQISRASLPEPMRPLVEQFQNTALSLLSVNHQYPIFELEYNLPLQNHSGKFKFSYDQKTQGVTLHGHFFGHNNNKRMNKLVDMIAIEGRLFGYDIKKDVHYDLRSQALAFTWSFDAHDLDHFANVFIKAIRDYDHITNNDSALCSNQNRIVENLMERHHVQTSGLNETTYRAIEPHITRFQINLKSFQERYVQIPPKQFYEMKTTVSELRKQNEDSDFKNPSVSEQDLHNKPRELSNDNALKNSENQTLVPENLSAVSTAKQKAPVNSIKIELVLNKSGYNTALDNVEKNINKASEPSVQEFTKELHRGLSTSRNQFRQSGEMQSFLKTSTHSIRRSTPELQKNAFWKQILLDLVNALIFIATLGCSYIATGRFRIFSVKNHLKDLEQLRQDLGEKHKGNEFS